MNGSIPCSKKVRKRFFTYRQKVNNELGLEGTNKNVNNNVILERLLQLADKYWENEEWLN